MDLCYLQAIQGHSGGLQIEPELMGYVKKFVELEETPSPQRTFVEVSFILGKGLIPGGKEKDKARQAVFLTPTNPFGHDPEEEEPREHFAVPRKDNQNSVYWVRLSKAHSQGLEFWQTKSFAIMTYATIFGDCVDRVTSLNGERVDFERLETPGPAPKVTLKKIWQSLQQQQQHSSSCTDILCLVKTKEVKEHWTGVHAVRNFPLK